VIASKDDDDKLDSDAGVFMWFGAFSELVGVLFAGGGDNNDESWLRLLWLCIDVPLCLPAVHLAILSVLGLPPSPATPSCLIDM
jgi:hypothetical protein